MSTTRGQKVEPLPVQTLAIVLPALSERDVDRYAIIPYHDTYDMVLQETIKAFVSLRPHINTTNSVLRYRLKNAEGCFVWADVQPEHWLQLVRPGAEVGLCPAETPFLVGSVFLTFGKEFGPNETRWTHSDKDRVSREIWIDRPRSFQEANVSVRNVIDSLNDTSGFESLLKGKGGNSFKYFYFEKARRGELRNCEWCEFPEEAYAHDSLWRKIVSRPGSFLGFKLQSESPPTYVPSE